MGGFYGQGNYGGGGGASIETQIGGLGGMNLGGGGLDLSKMLGYLKPKQATGMAQETGRLSLQDQNLAMAQKNAAMQEAQTRAQTAMEARRQAPMRTSFGLGYIAPNQLDESRMSAAQRQMFLPQNASFAQMGAGGEMSPSQQATSQRRALSDLKFDEEFSGEAARKRREALQAQPKG